MAAESGGKCHPVILEPFIHQVGGRSSMLCLDEFTICKPLIPQEQNFYITLPDSLKPFTAEYRGVIEVAFSENQDGYLTLTAHQPFETTKNGCSAKYITTEPDTVTNKTKYRIRRQNSGAVEIEQVRKEEAHLFEEDNGLKDTVTTHNPWSLRCHSQQLQKLLSSPEKPLSGTIQKFILLENLTAKYRYPCILDLKMGTRQYGDDASEKKRQSLDAKVASTTSCQLGLRVCGVQVHHVNTERYKCYNKYYGRTLTVETFRQTLFNFLHNGVRLRKDVLQILLCQLQSLYKVVQQLETFRFYTSSLLVLYDGNETNRFGCSCNLENSRKKFLEKNDRSANGIEKESNMNGCSIENERCQVCFKSLAEVRMIDFAHSVHSGLSHLVQSGPDDGYLFGLQNLIAQLKIIQQEHQGP